MSDMPKYDNSLSLPLSLKTTVLGNLFHLWGMKGGVQGDGSKGSGTWPQKSCLGYMQPIRWCQCAVKSMLQPRQVTTEAANCSKNVACILPQHSKHVACVTPNYKKYYNVHILLLQSTFFKGRPGSGSPSHVPNLREACAKSGAPTTTF